MPSRFSGRPVAPPYIWFIFTCNIIHQYVFKMANTKFEVDLGNLKLSAAQQNAINAAIQQAVLGEIARMSLKGDIVLLPIKRPYRPGGPIINGVIGRYINKANLKNVLGNDGSIGK